MEKKVGKIVARKKRNERPKASIPGTLLLRKKEEKKDKIKGRKKLCHF